MCIFYFKLVDIIVTFNCKMLRKFQLYKEAYECINESCKHHHCILPPNLNEGVSYVTNIYIMDYTFTVYRHLSVFINNI